MSVISVEKDFDSPSLILLAEFDAPIERVWQLWADPRQLERWWGPPTHPSTVEKHDLAADGEVTYVMTGPGGEKSRGRWRVTSVDPPPRRLASAHDQVVLLHFPRWRRRVARQVALPVFR